MKPITKVVIPVAGWGTRSLPATKNIPKEMLPIYNKPVIQYVVEEAQQSGIDDVVLVTNRDKSVIEDHFDHNLQLEGYLRQKNKTELLKVVEDVAEMVNVISVRQKQQKGLGHAILCARDAIGNNPFAVMVGDDLIFSGMPGIKQLIEVAMSENMPVVGVMEVPWENVDRYGIVDAEKVESGVYRVNNLVEKPSRDKAPSRLAIVGRYVLTPDIFDYIEKTPPGVGGEVQLTDAMQALCKDRGMMAVKIRGKRFDAGNWPEFLSANIYFGLQDENIRYPLIADLKEFLQLE
ncbi:UTP--glucose-1-phosphate uridylyltransferase [Desulfovibrio sp. An276]|uniref:UTP--glucose-1-phosphate uridylyltransferase GalU n=1 Tax=Desulfovibrio sp. An276 TaxID=1965618 RepID=UPI000B3A63D3|nr:UTP--glucose-1-phosphate uridylyltransferase GalU [Desulfovibrio sp. An276]OUO51291.1 UTP--glucose-1-phosphate uridylyltransferase [Desulfovibrio sp. An276]